MRLAISLTLLAVLAGCSAPVSAEKAALETEDQKTLYALGLALSQRLTTAGFSEAEVETIQAGLADGLLGRDARVELQVYGPKIDGLIRAKMAAANEAEKKESQAFYEAKAAEEGAQKTASGALYFEVEPGTGATPAQTDSVKVHYHGTLRDGTVFDSSVDRGEPATFSLGGVVPCFSEGIQMMQVGGKAKLVCPAETAYGDRGSPPKISPGATIQFEVELLEIVGGS
jgi:FKBP-type peptidyl-prolyl cis-trans isomerase FkpA/FKBP-type peptidyl-prolyl cis-trans isomerase FklB